MASPVNAPSSSSSSSSHSPRLRCDACARGHRACDRAGPPCNSCALTGRRCRYKGDRSHDKLREQAWAALFPAQHVEIPTRSTQQRSPEVPKRRNALQTETNEGPSASKAQPALSFASRTRSSTQNSASSPRTEEQDVLLDMHGMFGMGEASGARPRKAQKIGTRTSAFPLSEDLGVYASSPTGTRRPLTDRISPPYVPKPLGSLVNHRAQAKRIPWGSSPTAAAQPVTSPPSAHTGPSPGHNFSPAQLHEVQDDDRLAVAASEDLWHASEDASSNETHSIGNVEPRLQIVLSSPLAGQLMDLYMEEVDPHSEMLIHTRIDQAALAGPGDILRQFSAPLRKTIVALTLAAIAQVAQLCPAKVELIMLNGDVHTGGNRIFVNAEELERTAYTAALATLENIYSSIGPCELEAEFFAASYCLRTYEKISGQMVRCTERLIVDTFRLQKAGLHRAPRSRESSTQDAHVPKSVTARDLLEYRIFWLYLDKSRATALITQTGYTIPNKAFNIPLRSDAPSSDNGNSENQRVAPADAPRLSQYAALSTRIGLYMGECYDQLLLLAHATSWQCEAEKWSEKIPQQCNAFCEEIEKAADKNALTPPQSHSLRCLLAQAKAIVARQLWEEFVARMLAEPQARTKLGRWFAHKMRLDASSNLIEIAIATTNRRAGQAKHPTPILMRVLNQKFLKQQVVHLFEVLTKIVNVDHDLLVEQETRSHTCKHVRQALRGFNHLVIQTRHSPVRAVQALRPLATQALASFLLACRVDEHAIVGFRNPGQETMAEALVLAQVQREINRLALENAPASPIESSDLSLELEQLFEEVPNLQQLFRSTAW